MKGTGEQAIYFRLGPLLIARTPHQHSLHTMPFLLDCIERSSLQLCLVVDASGLPFPYNISSIKNVPHVCLQWSLQQPLPSPGMVNLFCDVVLKHVMENPGKVALVHDKDGLDRAGYLACHYLIRTTLKPMSWVLSGFYQARPPGLSNFTVEALADYYAAPGVHQSLFGAWEPVWEETVGKVRGLCTEESFLVCMGLDAYACIGERVWRTRFVLPPLVQHPTIMRLYLKDGGREGPPTALKVDRMVKLHGHPTSMEPLQQQRYLFDDFILRPRAKDHMNQHYNCHHDPVTVSWCDGVEDACSPSASHAPAVCGAA